MQWVSVDLLTLGLCFNWDRERCTARHQCHNATSHHRFMGRDWMEPKAKPPWVDYGALKIRPS